MMYIDKFIIGINTFSDDKRDSIVDIFIFNHAGFASEAKVFCSSCTFNIKNSNEYLFHEHCSPKYVLNLVRKGFFGMKFVNFILK